MRNKSIKTKLFVLSFFGIIIASFISIICMYIGSESIYSETLDQSIESSMNSVMYRIDEMKSISAKMAKIIATDPNVRIAVMGGRKESLLAAVNTLMQTYDFGVEYATISDAQGIVLARTYSDKSGDSVTNQKNVQSALNGASSSFIEPGSEIKLALRSSVPILDSSGRIVGVVSAGYRLENDSFVDNLSHITGTDITIFKNDIRISTTISVDGVRQVGTPLNPDIAKIVLENAEEYKDFVKIFGKSYYVFYKPIVHDGEVLGAYFVGHHIDDLESNKMMTMIISISAMLAICTVMIFVITKMTKKQIADPIMRISEAALKLSKGDFDINHLLYQSRDEIGRLSGSMNDMSTTFSGLITDLNNMSRQHHLGDIDIFIEKDRYTGSYQDVAEAVNLMVSEHIETQKTAMNCVSEMVDGNFSAAIDELPGKKAFINRSIDELRSSLRGINKEVDSLIKHAISGNLSARIDSQKYKGDWASLLNDLNTLMEAIVEPLSEVSAVLGLISAGNFDKKVEGNYHGDFLSMKDSLNSMAENVASYIDEISAVLGGLANNNLNQSVTRDYLGKFSEIKEALNNIIEKFNHIISEIISSAEQVSAAAEQISQSSMTLAQGATEQTASIEELTSTVTSVNDKTQTNALNANEATELSEDLKNQAVDGNKQMKDMLESMKAINEASSNISKIITIIKDISFQTNLLALNASIEAAHAGTHGAGFSVVAEEVRNLAAKSQEAADDTTELIEISIQRVAEGAGIAAKTDAALGRILDGVSNVSEIISKISSASGEQSVAISQINNGVGEIAEVAQNNSATSEESASASEQLSSQAETLKNLVSIFKLKK